MIVPAPNRGATFPEAAVLGATVTSMSSPSPHPIRLLAVSTVAVFAVGVVVALATPGPLLLIDDTGYFAMAHTMAGGGPAPMAAQAPYGVVYPLLLVPGWLIGLDSSAMVVWARLVNAAAGAALVPVLYVIAMRVTSVGRSAAVAGAFVGALYPAGLVTASIAWPERLMMLLVALAFLGVIEAARTGSVRLSVGSVVLAVLLYGTHPRLGLLAVVLIVAMVWVGRRRSAGFAVTLLAAGAVGLLAVEALRSAVAVATFGSAGRYGVSDIAARRGLDTAAEIIAQGTGTVAYVVLATALVGVWGAFGLLRSDWRWLVVAMMVVVGAVVAWFLPGVPRSDRWLHGRYVEVFAPLLLAVGFATLDQLRSRRAIAAVVGVGLAAGIVAVVNGPPDVWAQGSRPPVMMLGVEFAGAPYGASPFRPAMAAAAAGVVAVLLWLAALRFGVVKAAVLAVAVSLWAAHAGDATLDQLFDTTVAGDVAANFPHDEVITELHVDPTVVSGNLTNALAFAVGFDHSVLEPTEATSHVLLPVDGAAPPGAELVAQFERGWLWRVDPAAS